MIFCSTRASCARPRWPAQGKRSPLSGNKVSRVIVRGLTPETSAALGRCGNSTSRACDKLPSVADSPQMRSCGVHPRKRARHNCSSTPRLLPSSSCHSSTITQRSADSCGAVSGYDNSKASDSGVVTSTSSLPLRARRLSRALASPVRRPTCQSSPKASTGSRSARAVSAASARNGVIHNTCRLRCCWRRAGDVALPGLPGDLRPRAANASSNGPPNAASVLPLPVGVCSRPDSPSR